MERRKLRSRRSFWFLLLLSTLALKAPPASAQGIQTYTLDTYLKWLQQYQDAKPAFKPGDVLTSKDLDKLRPFIIPGFIDQLDFPDFRLAVQPVQSHQPRKDYMGCTEKYQSQVRLNPDGTMANYVCGQPFADASLSPGDATSGLKSAWNFEYRWQNFGLIGVSWNLTWVRFGGEHNGQQPSIVPEVPTEWLAGFNIKTRFPANISEEYGGGGSFQRNLGAYYRRVYFSHLAQEEANRGLLPVPDAKLFEFKEFTGFQAPFDIRGTVFIVYRYSDPHRPDDGWAYIPQLRRVRRISAEVKSDSMMGTDHTIADFYGFADRELDWKWKFLGWKDVLGLMDQQQLYLHCYGTNGLIVNDPGWSLRKFAVVERTPIDPRAPYSAVLNFWDSENWDSWFEVAFDRGGKLWKIWEYPKKWSETYTKEWSEMNQGAHSTTFTGVPVMDLQNSRGTIIIGYGVGFPVPTPREVVNLYDISKLEELHR
jgi:Protein of unknown function (DUF1329)